MIERTLRKIEDTLHLAGCLSLVAVAVLINADILLRLIANRPVQIQFELTELYLMPALATLSLSRVFRDGGHLALDFGPETLPGLWGTLLAKARLLLPATFFAAITFMSAKFAWGAFAHHEVEYGVIDWPLGWAYAVAPLGCGVLVLRLIHDVFRPAEPDLTR
ncbi:TRAP transporter small permease [Pseudophaeobacter sp. C1-32P7]|uniref:TRAP transporter small permease n=1 Tax=Pseudophaeobacter sp. C1-32P7 TaxID=3098142 RepID=UPI0034D7BB46